MTEIFTSLLLLMAAAVVLLAAVGLLRMPDLPTRMHATTKSGVLAIMFIMVAVCVYFGQLDVYARVFAIIVFTLISAPIAAHAIGRSAYLSGVKLCKETVRDELQDYYHEEEPCKKNDPTP